MGLTCKSGLNPTISGVGFTFKASRGILNRGISPDISSYTSHEASSPSGGHGVGVATLSIVASFLCQASPQPPPKNHRSHRSVFKKGLQRPLSASVLVWREGRWKATSFQKASVT